MREMKARVTSQHDFLGACVSPTAGNIQVKEEVKAVPVNKSGMATAMGEPTTKEKILANLREFGLSTDIRPQTLNQLRAIEETLLEMSDARATGVQMIRDSRPMVATIAKQSGISRATFYNNRILVDYIEAWEKKNGENPFDTIDRLHAELAQKEAMVKNMIARDAEVEVYKSRCDKLQEQVDALRRDNERRAAETASLRKELSSRNAKRLTP